MKRNLGNVEYDADAALYPGASYQEETDVFTPEILLVDGDDELLDDAAADDKKLFEKLPEGLEGNKPMPVSYTHLDVYKSQSQ